MIPTDDRTAGEADSHPSGADPEVSESGHAGPSAESSDSAGKLREERDFYVDQLQRSRADLDNFRRRVQRDHEQTRQRLAIDFLRALLPVYDDLRLAVQADAHAADPAQLRVGLRLIVEKFERMLTDAQVEMIDATGQPFDPAFHEAILQEETEAVPPGQVLEVFEAGYRLGSELIRPARVKVARAPTS